MKLGVGWNGARMTDNQQLQGNTGNAGGERGQSVRAEGGCKGREYQSGRAQMGTMMQESLGHQGGRERGE